MHFEILIEDQSGKKMLNLLIPKIINDGNTFAIHSYKGIGRIPTNLTSSHSVRSQFLLSDLPRLLRAYGNTFNAYPNTYNASVIVVCDLDDKCLKTFRQELYGVLDSCNQKPETKFCIAIEEGEAWLLGDIPAIKIAYPNSRDNILSSYVNDSICGTWELLADAVYTGGSQRLQPKGYQVVGKEKSDWAKNITPNMDIDNNQSPSFNYFKEKLLDLCE